MAAKCSAEDESSATGNGKKRKEHRKLKLLATNELPREI